MFYLLFLIGAHEGCQQDREFRHGGVVLELTGILVRLLLTLVLSFRDLGEDNTFVSLQIRLAQNMVNGAIHHNSVGILLIRDSEAAVLLESYPGGGIDRCQGLSVLDDFEHTVSILSHSGRTRKVP